MHYQINSDLEHYLSGCGEQMDLEFEMFTFINSEPRSEMITVVRLV